MFGEGLPEEEDKPSDEELAEAHTRAVVAL